jgi:eukaryotic-like serine/threonine-protein kinase
MEPAEAEQRVGTTLRNKWKLERLLGVGGMAAVYVAVHKIGRREAVKILHPDIARSDDLRARFELEAHVANKFKHPGAVEIRDIDKTDDGAPFLVMELLEGESLSDRVRRADIAYHDLLRHLDELLDVLAAAHAQGIVHRDIKLDNLFVLKDGSLKVLDFGIARVRDGGPGTNRTRLGATLGTAPYMAPEQVTGNDVDGRADLFAVGATMFRVLAKRRVHEADNESELLVKMATQPAPSLASVAPSVPRDLCLVVDRALRFRREDRYPNAAAMQSDIRALRQGAPPSYALARWTEDGGAPAPAGGSSGQPTRIERTHDLAPAPPVVPPVSQRAPDSATRPLAASQPSRPDLGGPASVPIGLVPRRAPEAFASDPGPRSVGGPASIGSDLTAFAPAPPAPVGPPSAAISLRQHGLVLAPAASLRAASSADTATHAGDAEGLGSTLKSEGIGRQAPLAVLPSAADIPVQSAPPSGSVPYAPVGVPAYGKSFEDQKKILKLALFGVAFLVLGVVIVVVAWPSDGAPDSPYERTDAADPGDTKKPAGRAPAPRATQPPSPNVESQVTPTSNARPDPNRSDPPNNNPGQGSNPGGGNKGGGRGNQGKGKGHGKNK